MGEILNTFPDQDHDVHIRMHLMFMKTPLVMTSPQVMGTFYAHILEHVSQKARKAVMEEIENLIQQAQQQAQAGALNASAVQQQIMQIEQSMQDPAQLEKLIAMQIEQIMTEITPQLMPQGNDPMSDPLVQIRMQELAIKQQDQQRKASDDEVQLNLERMKLQQRAASDAARIESQEEIAAQRDETNRERIDVQRQKMIMG
jgi:hypothetical protein